MTADSNVNVAFLSLNGLKIARTLMVATDSIMRFIATAAATTSKADEEILFMEVAQIRLQYHATYCKSWPLFLG